MKNKITSVTLETKVKQVQLGSYMGLERRLPTKLNSIQNYKLYSGPSDIIIK